ncbi:N-acetyltransferase family protein [Vibrio kasasachensis]|uniref:GNAT family N-acetyltransferase n=1 Tax=Vibrio kasasachensis TaxID=2910248 RepID=UPI003D110CC0
MFTIRAAKSDDLEQLNELMYQLHHEHHLQAPDSFKTAQEIEQEKSIARYLDNPDCLVFTAMLDGQILGFITGHFCELISSVSKPVQMGSVDELYVLPSFRKQKVAQCLYQVLEQRFEEYGVQQVFVEVWNFNQTACQFYFNSGFEHHIHWLRKVIK